MRRGCDGNATVPHQFCTLVPPPKFARHARRLTPSQQCSKHCQACCPSARQVGRKNCAFAETALELRMLKSPFRCGTGRCSWFGCTGPSTPAGPGTAALRASAPASSVFARPCRRRSRKPTSCSNHPNPSWLGWRERSRGQPTRAVYTLLVSPVVKMGCGCARVPASLLPAQSCADDGC